VNSLLLKNIPQELRQTQLSRVTSFPEFPTKLNVESARKFDLPKKTIETLGSRASRLR
jgi:hypothetical protein